LFGTQVAIMRGMTRNEFNLILQKTLVSLGEAENELPVDKDPAWDGEFEKMKHLSIGQFADLCNAGVSLYWRSSKSLLN